MAKVSIIMPSLNVAGYICECMESVISQTLKDIEILCIDAGSTDGTLEILEKYASISRFKYLSISLRMLFRECKGKSGGVVVLR